MSDHRKLEISLDQRGLGQIVLGGEEIQDMVYGLEIQSRAGERPVVALIVDPDKLDLTLEEADISLELPTPESAEEPTED